MSEPGTNEALQFALLGTKTGITSWGHEYLRTLSGEISNTYKKRVEAGAETDLKDLQFLIDEIIPFNMHHNAEPDAVDLCLEINRLPLLVDVNLNNYLFSNVLNTTMREFAYICSVVLLMQLIPKNMKLA
jgi:26S proteasome regulatory subunit N1